MNEYKTIEGTQPHTHVEHQPRVVERHTDDDLMMMTEIGDGVFVQWGNCRRCSERVGNCQCKGGPVEPPYMKTWRDERFKRELDTRPNPDYDLLPSVLEWVRERGYTVTKDEPEIERKSSAFDDRPPGNVYEVAEDLAIPDLTDKERDDFAEALNIPDVDDERDHEETGPDGDARTYDTETGDKIDEGLDAALEKVKSAKEDEEDVGF